MIHVIFNGQPIEFNLAEKPIHVGRFSKSFIINTHKGKFFIKYANKEIHFFEKERFTRQHNIWNTLYPQIPSALIETAEGFIFIREFLDGKNFLALNKKEPKILLLKDALKEIKRLHTLKYLCTDIKPHNFIVTPQQKVILIDVGSCIPLPFTYTTQYVIPFTFLYAPPEMILNRYDLCDESSDYYMWAMMAFHLLTDKPPFDHCNPVILMHQQLNTFPDYNRIKDKEMKEIIQLLTYKELFPLPPHKMPKSQIQDILIRSIAKRNEFIKKLTY